MGGAKNNNARKSKQRKGTPFGVKNNHSSATKTKLIEFIIKTAELQRKLQIIKELLCEQEHFTPASLFHRLDRHRKGYISEKDIENYLIQSNIKFKGSELKTLFGRIDENRNGRVSQRQFQNFILPNQNPRLRYFTMRRAIIIPRKQERLDTKIQWIASKLFTQIITQYTRLMEYNSALVNSFDFDFNKMFELISQDGRTINGEDIQDFMADNSVDISVEEVGGLLRLLDKKAEGRIHRDDFKVYLATLGLKKEHEIFDQLSPVPALKDFHSSLRKPLKDRDATLKQRYKDNKSYARGMDQDGHHLLGYSRVVDHAQRNGYPWQAKS